MLQVAKADMFYFRRMTLTHEEEKFVAYWEENRLKRKKVFRQLAVGLPLGVVLVAAIFINFFAGWYKKADIVLRTESSVHSQFSLILVLLVAAIAIVVFIVVFSAKHKWDMYEQQYLELMAKKNQP